MWAKKQTGFHFRPDSQSLLLYLPHEQFRECLEGNAEPLALHQLVALRMLEEQGEAESLPNGFRVFEEAAVSLDSESRELFGLPAPWPGGFDMSFIGETRRRGFEIRCALELPDGSKTGQYKMHGPILRLSEQEEYLPDPAQWTVLDTARWHGELSGEDRSEYNNLLAVHRFREAKQAGAQIQLAHFDELETAMPDSVAVAARETENGDIVLSPSFPNIGTDYEEIESRLGQLSSQSTASFRVKKKIVLLDEKKFEAIREIIEHRHIPKEQVQQFLETPSAFLDATLVDLDVGFSFRMHGATEFRHAYFGRTDAATTTWFPSEGQSSEAKPNLRKSLREMADIYEFREQMEDAKRAGASAFFYNGNEFSLGMVAELEKELDSIEKEMLEKHKNAEEKSIKDQPSKEEPRPPLITTDIDTHDEVISEKLRDGTDLEFAPWSGDIDWSQLKRYPYKHQEDGVAWILGHMDSALKHPRPEGGIRGCLLADDMGLGKTYMALVAMAKYLKMREEANFSTGPILVVAPSILLEIWKKEVEKTFETPPFRDIVILQGTELAKYKKSRGMETHGGPGEIRFCLKIGKDEFPLERLDMPKRLVLSTYDTMRNYQFSMCAIDWSMVVFDEAQAIKNPNSLQTRTAKGLRSGFNLLVTGTPVENDLRDFWCLFDTAFPGFLGSYQEFRSEYMTPIYKSPPESIAEIREKVGRKLRNRVGDFMLRRTKEDNLDDLPKKRILLGAPVPETYTGILRIKHEPTLECTMQGRQRYLYDDIVTATLSALESGQKGAALKGLHQLRDVSLHAGIVDGGSLSEPNRISELKSLQEVSTKLARLFDLVDEIRVRNEKVILMLINRRLQRFLATALRMKYQIPVEIINGETRSRGERNAKETRHTLIDKFEKRGGFGILIMSPLAAGVGLTVTSANNVIHMERHWNPAKEDQATDRVYRIGQSRDVNVYIPIAHHPEVASFEVNLNKLLTRKTDLKDAVIAWPDIKPDQIQAEGIFSGDRSSPTEEPINFKDLSAMSWSHFEALVAELAMREFDAEVWLTAESGDHGCDVIVLGGSNGNMLVQCKYLTGKGALGESAAREVFSAKPYYEEKGWGTFDHLIVCTNTNRVTRDLGSIKRRYGVELWKADTLKKLLTKHKVKQTDVLGRLHADRLS